MLWEERKIKSLCRLLLSRFVSHRFGAAQKIVCAFAQAECPVHRHAYYIYVYIIYASVAHRLAADSERFVFVVRIVDFPHSDWHFDFTFSFSANSIERNCIGANKSGHSTPNKIIIQRTNRRTDQPNNLFVNFHLGIWTNFLFSIQVTASDDEWKKKCFVCLPLPSSVGESTKTTIRSELTENLQSPEAFFFFMIQQRTRTIHILKKIFLVLSTSGRTNLWIRFVYK